MSPVFMLQNAWIDAHQRAGAVDPDNARAPRELDRRPGMTFHQLVKAGVLIQCAPGKYYLSEDAAEAFRAARRRKALYFFLILAVLYALYLTFVPGLIVQS